MPIKVEWIDPNGVAPVTIYRSETPIPDSPLPDPLAVVESGSSYLDETAVRNKLYYYRVSRPDLVDGNIVLSANKLLAYMPYTGPGPQELKRGDWNFGIFGTIPMGKFFSAQELVGFSGITAMIETNVALNEWVKFVFKGKIYFTPLYAVGTSFSWKSLYDAGLVYGDIPEAQWPAYPKTTFGVIPQKKTIVYGEHSFSIRIPTSRKDPLNTSTAVNNQIGGEYDQFISALFAKRVHPDPNGNQQLLDAANPPTAAYSADVSGSSVISRGYTTDADSVYELGLVSGAASHGWRPLLILEL